MELGLCIGERVKSSPSQLVLGQLFLTRATRPGQFVPCLFAWETLQTEIRMVTNLNSFENKKMYTVERKLGNLLPVSFYK